MRHSITNYILVILLLFSICLPVSAAVDDSYTVTLMHFDNNTDNGAVFKDESGKVWIRNSGGNTSKQWNKFGPSSLNLPQNASNLHFLYTAPSTDFDFGTGDYTVDAWLNMSQQGYSPIFSAANVSTVSGYYHRTTSTDYGLQVLYNNSDNTAFLMNSSSTNVVFENTTTHVAFVKNGSQFYIFVNGNMVMNQTPSGLSFNSYGYTPAIGVSDVIQHANRYKGFIDELRVSKGIARWNRNFTPPDYAYGSLILSNFTGNVTTIFSGQYISFSQTNDTNTSTWNWSFGDGYYSEQHFPVHQYTSGGLKTVNLTASNYALTSINTTTKTNYITVNILPPVASFTQNITSGNVPAPASFTDTSTNTPTSWLWEFGDGNTSTSQNPTYTYYKVGNYTVTLNATNIDGSNSSSKFNTFTALLEPYVPLSNANAEYGTGIISPISTAWQWIGDEKYSAGTLRSGDTAGWVVNTSFDTVEKHGGNQSIKIIASGNSIGHNWTTIDNNLWGQSVPHKLILTPGKAYNFSFWMKTQDSSWVSIGSIWTAASSYGSSTQYSCNGGAVAGTTGWTFYSSICDIPLYNNSFDLFNYQYDNGTTWYDDFKLMKMLTPNISASNTSGWAPFSVTFNGSTTNGTATYWNWSFGDGNFSNSQNTTYNYASVGTYTVILTTANGIGNENPSNITNTNYITVSPAAPLSRFGKNDTYGNRLVPVQFNDLSTNISTSWNWTATNVTGNNTQLKFSTLQNPVFTFDVGNWFIKLNATNTYGSNTSIQNSWVNVTPLPPVANFTINASIGSIPLPILFNDASTNVPNGWSWYFGDENYDQNWILQNTTPLWSRYFPEFAMTSNGDIIMTGGYNTSFISNNSTWKSSDMGVTWQLVNISTPFTGRLAGGMVVLPDDSLVLMGGYDGITFYNDTWRSTDKGVTWQLMNISSGWDVRNKFGYTIINDGSIFIFGGNSPSSHKNDTWISTDKGSTWQLINDNPGWESRMRFAFTKDHNDDLYVIGGQINGAGYTTLNDTWRSTDKGVTWQLMNSSGGWSKRMDMAVTVMPDNSLMMIGGYNETQLGLSDTWRSTDNGSSWSLIIDNNSFGNIWGMNNAISSNDGSVILIGGYNGTIGVLNRVWRFNPLGSSSQNPTHTYNTIGNYSSVLLSYNIGGFNISSSQLIRARSSPVASFTSNITSGQSPLGVQFTDTSIYIPDTWNWYYKNSSGNNTEILFSNSQNPFFLFPIGSWDIRLNSSNIYGYNSTSYGDYIINADLNPAFTTNITDGINEATVQFIDNTLTSVLWSWRASDVNGHVAPFIFSTDQYPVYTFSVGNYSIVLTINNSFNEQAVSQQITYINVSPYNNASLIPYPTIGTPFVVSIFATRDQAPAAHTKINITSGGTADNTTTISAGGYTDSSGKYVFLAKDSIYYKIIANDNEYQYTYMGSSSYATITIVLPSNRMMTRPYEYTSTFDSNTNTISTIYQDTNQADVNIGIIDVTFNNGVVHTANYTSTSNVNDNFVVPYPDHQYKVIIEFVRSVSPSHTYSDTIFINSNTFGSKMVGVSDQWKLFIYGIYSLFLMIVSLSIGYASPKYGSLMLVGLTVAGVMLGFLPYSIYTGGIFVCSFIALLEVMRRRPD